MISRHALNTKLAHNKFHAIKKHLLKTNRLLSNGNGNVGELEEIYGQWIYDLIKNVLLMTTLNTIFLYNSSSSE